MMKKRQNIFAIIMIVFVSMSTLFQPVLSLAERQSNELEDCDCIHMEKDVEGKVTHEEDREKKFDFNLKFMIPKQVADKSNEIVVKDVVDNRLKIHSAAVVTKDGANVQGLSPTIDGQEVSLVLTEDTIDQWSDKELHVKVVTSINENVPDSEVIPNTFTIDLGDGKYTSNEAVVKSSSVPLTPIKPVEVEMPSINKDVNGSRFSGTFSKGETFNFNIKTSIPNNLNTYEKVRIVDEIDDKFKIISTKVKVDNQESSFNAKVADQEVSLELSRDELNGLKGKEITIQVQVEQQMVVSDNRRYNTATVTVESKNGEVKEEETVESNRVYVDPTGVSVSKTVEGDNIEQGRWSSDYIIPDFTSEYTFIIKSQLPTLEQLGEGFTDFHFADNIDNRLEILSAEVFLDGVPYTDLPNSFIQSQFVGGTFEKDKYEQMQGKEMLVKITVKTKEIENRSYPSYIYNTSNITFNFMGAERAQVNRTSSRVQVEYPKVHPDFGKRVNGSSSLQLKNEHEEFSFELTGFVSEHYEVNGSPIVRISIEDVLDENFEILSTELRVGDETKDSTKYIELSGNELNFKVESKDIKEFYDKEFVITIHTKLKEGYANEERFSNSARYWIYYSNGNGSGRSGNTVYVYPPQEEVPPSKESVSVQKVWVGEEQNSVTVELLANGSKVDQVVLSNSNNWKHTFTELDGSKSYSVKEVQVDGYETKITGSAKNGFVITNTEIKDDEPSTDLPLICECEVPTTPMTPIEPAKTSIDVNKVWKGEEQDSATINLLADGKKVDSIVLNADKDWKHTFKDLPVVNDTTDEQAIVYTVEEIEIEGYEVSIAGNAQVGFTVTNTETVPQIPITPSTTKVDVEKVWKLYEQKEQDVTINLLADGKKVDSIVLNADNDWKHTFKDLPVVNDITDEQAIVYTVEEIVIEGYEVSIAGNAQVGFTVTNTETVPQIPITPSTTKVDVEKVWKLYEQKEQDVTINLLADGKKVDSIVLNAENDWKHTFTDLPVVNDVTDEQAIVYTVEEIVIEGYEISIAGNAQVGFTVTNTEIVPQTPIEPAKTSVDVNKVWKGEKQDSVTINLLANGKEVDSIVLNADNDWKHTFTDLPVVNDITDEQAIVYTVEEIAIEGYEVSIAGNAVQGFTVTNTETVPQIPITPSTTKVDVEKVWELYEKKEQDVTINLLADGKKIDSIVLNADKDWKHTFKDLPVVNDVKDEQAILYTVEEITIDGFEVTIKGNAKEGFTITNTEIVSQTPIVPSTTKVDVSKVWKLYEKKEQDVTINLLADGKKIDSIVLNADKDWKHTFKDLPVVNDITDEQAIAYTVEEVTIDGFEVTIEGNANDGFVVTNTEIVPLTPIETVESEEVEVEAEEAEEIVKPVVKPTEEGGKPLPSTATNIFNMLSVGAGLLLAAGVAGVTYYRKRKLATDVDSVDQE